MILTDKLLFSGVKDDLSVSRRNPLRLPPLTFRRGFHDSFFTTKRDFYLIAIAQKILLVEILHE